MVTVITACTAMSMQTFMEQRELLAVDPIGGSLWQE